MGIGETVWVDRLESKRSLRVTPVDWYDYLWSYKLE